MNESFKSKLEKIVFYTFLLVALLIFAGTINKIWQKRYLLTQNYESSEKTVLDDSQLNNEELSAPLFELKDSSIVHLFDKIDTTYDNERTKSLPTYRFTSKDNLGVKMSRTKFHEYLLQHLKEGYNLDTNINIKTSDVAVEIVKFQSNNEYRWLLEYYLWYNNDIILSCADNVVGINTFLPDMSQYGYK